MDAFFIIPALVSPNVSENIVPMLTKTIERNIILTNYGSIRMALMKKYANAKSTRFTEGETIFMDDSFLMEGPNKQKPTGLGMKSRSVAGTAAATAATAATGNSIAGAAAGAVADTASNAIGFTKPSGGESFGSSREAEGLNSRAKTAPIDHVEYPTNIKFFHSISLEPTYLEIPITVKNSVGNFGTSDRVLMVGFKCVPYALDGVSDIIRMASDDRARSEVGKWFRNKFRTAVTQIPLTVPNAIRKHGVRGGSKSRIFARGKVKYDPVKDIMYSPISTDLANPNKLAKLMSVRGRSTWSTMCVFSSYDFEAMDMRDTLMQYRDLVSAGWGDMVVVNESNEQAHFCTQKMNACYQIGFSYMRNIMQLDNVLDYTEVARYSKPFSMRSVGQVLR